MSMEAIPGPDLCALKEAPCRHPRPEWIAPMAILGLTAAAFLPTLQELVEYWSSYPEYSHGFLMPPIALWLLWERRTGWRQRQFRPSVWGALLVIPCLLLLLLGEMKLSWFLKPYAFVGTLGAIATAFLGARAAIAAFPSWVALFLMCPLPGRVQEALSVPLKHSAALFATGLLDISGIATTLDGNLIHVHGGTDLWVADACSGIRSLIALVSLALLACLVWRRPLLLKAVVLLSAVPIAIFVNGIRIYVTGVVSVRIGPQAAHGFFHVFEGLVLFVAAGLLLWGWAWLLNRVFARTTS